MQNANTEGSAQPAHARILKFVCRNKPWYTLILSASKEDTDQTVRMCRLIWIFAVTRIWRKVFFALCAIHGI